ncbi:MAG: hypothetical protein JWO92_375 [Chitinophagaceae bacterium]|nr:hypothetical protein [Chitinophagaceae bacterium]
MRKLSLAVIGMYIGVLSAFSQTTTDSSAYKNKKLKPAEINFVTGYYHQDGNLSPVTGGIGTEKLSDFATTIELKLNKYDNKNRKHDVSFELGIDHYTSASSDKIDPQTISSASHADTRIYPSASYTITNEQKGNAVSFNGSFSNEYDYTSIGFGTGFTKTSKDKNTEFGIKLQAYLDNLKVILPIEMRTVTQGRDNNYPSASRNSYSGSLTFSQSLTQRLQLSLMLDLIYQSGYLSTPFHRIFFANGAETNEKLPSSRFKIPAGLRLNYFLGDKFIIRSYYRFYHDDWGLTASTFNIELPVKLTPYLSISPFYRYYSQNGVKYFAPYKSHSASELFYTTDDDLSKFNSNFYGAGIRFSPSGGNPGLKHLNNLELRYGHYNRTDGLNSSIITLALNFK